MATIRQALTILMSCEGAVCCPVVDFETGLMLGSAGDGLDLKIAAAANTEVMRAKQRAIRQLGASAAQSQRS
jgi:hypothetical protein